MKLLRPNSYPMALRVPDDVWEAQRVALLRLENMPKPAHFEQLTKDDTAQQALDRLLAYWENLPTPAPKPESSKDAEDDDSQP